MRLPLADAAILFDLDGTLIDTAGDLAAAMNYALAKAGRPVVEAAKVRHLVGHGARAMLKRGFEFSGDTPGEAALDAHVEDFLDFYLRHIADESRPFPHVIDEIDALRRDGAAVAICTNKREAPARRLIEELGLTERFDAIVGMDTTEAPKPNPAPARRCLDITGRIRGLFVGDSDTDIRTAIAVGMPCLIAGFGYGPLAEAERAQGVFETYEGFAALARRTLAGA